MEQGAEDGEEGSGLTSWLLGEQVRHHPPPFSTKTLLLMDDTLHSSLWGMHYAKHCLPISLRLSEASTSTISFLKPPPPAVLKLLRIISNNSEEDFPKWHHLSHMETLSSTRTPRVDGFSSWRLNEDMFSSTAFRRTRATSCTLLEVHDENRHAVASIFSQCTAKLRNC